MDRPYPVPRTVVVVIDGVRHEIPEAWLIGACRVLTLHAAVQLWHDQTRLARRIEAVA